MLFGSSQLVGLDIGTSSIKLVEVEKSRRGFKLKTFGFIPTPPGAINGGEIINADALAEAIRALSTQLGIRNKKVCTAIWGSAVITKKISIPRIDERLLGEQLKWEAEQYIPFDVNDINLEYELLNKQAASPDQMALVLVAAKRDFVLRFAEVVEMAGLQCMTVDVAGFALYNAFEANYGEVNGQTIAILNLGAGITNFVIAENGEVTFSRDIPVGGVTFTNDIQKTMGVSLQEAESLKISAGLGQPVPQEVTDSLKQTNEVVAEEVRRSFDFYLATAGEAAIAKVFVTGGGLGLPGLFEQLKITLNLPLEAFNPLTAVSYDAAKFPPEYVQQIMPYAAVGVGLSLRKVSDR